MVARIAAAAALSLSLGACFDPGDIDVSDETAAAQVPTEPDLPEDWVVVPGECPSTSCGLNEALLAGNDFHELKLGATNLEAMKLLAFTNQREEALEVLDDRLQVVRDPGQSLIAKSARADEIIGAEMHIQLGMDRYRIRVESMAGVKFAVNPDVDFTRFYRLKYRHENNVRWLSVCPGGSVAVLFAGDRYRKQTHKVIVEDEPSGWFNVACADGAIAKMHVLRHTSASETHAGTTSTTPAQRQALLNQLVQGY
jgi:hypothetical protein